MLIWHSQAAVKGFDLQKRSQSLPTFFIDSRRIQNSKHSHLVARTWGLDVRRRRTTTGQEFSQGLINTSVRGAGNEWNWKRWKARLGRMGGMRWRLTKAMCRPFRIAFTCTVTFNSLFSSFAECICPILNAVISLSNAEWVTGAFKQPGNTSHTWARQMENNKLQ